MSKDGYTVTPLPGVDRERYKGIDILITRERDGRYTATITLPSVSSRWIMPSREAAVAHAKAVVDDVVRDE